MDEVPNSLIYQTLLDMKGSLGRLEKGVEDNNSHIVAVSAKTDTVRVELTTHAQKDEAHYLDQDAHGKGNMTKLLVSVAAIVLGAEGAFHLVKMFWK